MKGLTVKLFELSGGSESIVRTSRDLKGRSFRVRRLRTGRTWLINRLSIQEVKGRIVKLFGGSESIVRMSRDTNGRGFRVNY